MSRIGRKPVPVPAKVTVNVKDGVVEVQGPKGTLKQPLHPKVSVATANGSITVSRADDAAESRAMHGLFRALINNMVQGVTQGFERKLDIIGVGYQAALKGKVLELTVGFANKVQIAVPEGVTVTLPTLTSVVVTGADKSAVGQFAAKVRAVKKPEPYGGTGIKYSTEVIRRKAGKAFGSK